MDENIKSLIDAGTGSEEDKKALEALVNAALTDGVLTDKERTVLLKKAKKFGVDSDELEMVLDAYLIKAAAEKSQATPKSNKMGDYRKCPACGAAIQALQTKCPECGYEFVGISGVSSMEKLQQMILGKNIDETAKIVSNFPVPNTREDIIEFLAAMSSKSYKPFSEIKEESVLRKTYYNKYKECCLKAKALFPDDHQIMLLASKEKGILRHNILHSKATYWILGIVTSLVMGPVFCRLLRPEENRIDPAAFYILYYIVVIYMLLLIRACVTRTRASYIMLFYATIFIMLAFSVLLNR